MSSLLHIIVTLNLKKLARNISFFQITANNHLAILSAPWYLNYIKYGSDWVKFYNIDPLDFGGNENNKKMVLGGEVI